MTQSPDAGEAITHQVDCLVFGLCSLSSLCTLGLPNSGPAIDNAEDQGRIQRRLKSNKKMQINMFESQNSHYPSAAPHRLLKRSVPLRHPRVQSLRPRLLLLEAMTESMCHLPFAFAKVSIFPFPSTLLCFPLSA